MDFEGFGSVLGRFWEGFGRIWVRFGRGWGRFSFIFGCIWEGWGRDMNGFAKNLERAGAESLLHFWKGFKKIWERFSRRLWTVFDHFFEYFLSWDPRAASNIYKILTTRLPPENSSVQLLTRAMQQVWKGTTLQRLPAELSSLPSPLLKLKFKKSKLIH